MLDIRAKTHYVVYRSSVGDNMTTDVKQIIENATFNDIELRPLLPEERSRLAEYFEEPFDHDEYENVVEDMLVANDHNAVYIPREHFLFMMNHCPNFDTVLEHEYNVMDYYKDDRIEYLPNGDMILYHGVGGFNDEIINIIKGEE